MTVPRHKRGPGGVEHGVRASNAGLWKGLVLGAVGAAAAGALAFYFAAAAGLFPANADAKPPALEKWIARKALDAAIVRQAPKGPNPVALNDENLIAGIKLYAATRGASTRRRRSWRSTASRTTRTARPTGSSPTASG